MAGHARSVRILERLLLTAGITLLAVFSVALVHRSMLSQAALREFESPRVNAVQKAAGERVPANDDAQLDTTLWSEKRIAAFRDALLSKPDRAFAVVRVEKLGLRAPVFAGTDEWNLNRGVGWIAGTAPPGELGNVGLAGHRDGFFRCLKDIAEGDTIELATAESVSTYAVDQIEIVIPEDVRVLQPRSVPSLTLVTCYPFYLVGSAPKRFIVHAALKQKVPVNKLDAGSASQGNQILEGKEKGR